MVSFQLCPVCMLRVFFTLIDLERLQCISFRLVMISSSQMGTRTVDVIGAVLRIVADGLAKGLDGVSKETLGKGFLPVPDGTESLGTVDKPKDIGFFGLAGNLL